MIQETRNRRRYFYQPMPSVRLQKFLADAGVASRRASEKLIVRGVVTVNGRVVTELGSKVDPLHDAVSVEGALVRPARSSTSH